MSCLNRLIHATNLTNIILTLHNDNTWNWWISYSFRNWNQNPYDFYIKQNKMSSFHFCPLTSEVALATQKSKGKWWAKSSLTKCPCKICPIFCKLAWLTWTTFVVFCVKRMYYARIRESGSTTSIVVGSPDVVKETQTPNGYTRGVYHPLDLKQS